MSRPRKPFGANHPGRLPATMVKVLAAEMSDREQAVLDLMPTGLSIREIAEELFLSKDTVKSHRRQIYRKLAVNTRSDAVVAARQLGLLPESGVGPAATDSADS